MNQLNNQDAGPSYTGLSDDVNNDYYNETDCELTDPLPKLSSEGNYLFFNKKLPIHESVTLFVNNVAD